MTKIFIHIGMLCTLLFCHVLHAQQTDSAMLKFQWETTTLSGGILSNSPETWQAGNNWLAMEGSATIEANHIPVNLLFRIHSAHDAEQNPVNMLRFNFSSEAFLSGLQKQFLDGTRLPVWREHLKGWQLKEKANLLENKFGQYSNLPDSMKTVLLKSAQEMDRLTEQMEQACFADLEKRWDQAQEKYGNLEDTTLLQQQLDSLKTTNAEKFHELESLARLKKLHSQLQKQHKRAESIAKLLSNKKQINKLKALVSKDYSSLIKDRAVLNKAGLLSKAEAYLSHVDHLRFGEMVPLTSSLSLGGAPMRGLDVAVGKGDFFAQFIQGKTYGQLKPLGSTDTLSLAGNLRSIRIGLGSKEQPGLSLEYLKYASPKQEINDQHTGMSVACVTSNQQLFKGKIQLGGEFAVFSSDQTNNTWAWAAAKGELIIQAGVHQLLAEYQRNNPLFFNPLSPWLIPGQTSYAGEYRWESKILELSAFGNRQLDEQALFQDKVLWAESFGLRSKINPWQDERLSLEASLAPMKYLEPQGNTLFQRNALMISANMRSVLLMGINGQLEFSAHGSRQQTPEDMLFTFGGGLAFQAGKYGNIGLKLDRFEAGYFPGLPASIQAQLDLGIKLGNRLAISSNMRLLQADEPLQWGGKAGLIADLPGKALGMLELYYQRMSFGQLSPQIVTQNQNGFFIRLQVQPFNKKTP